MNDKNKKKPGVLIVGTLPPPVGGVTIHLQRFFKKYGNHDKFELFLLDLRKRKIFYKDKIYGLAEIFKVIPHMRIVHIHVSNSLKLFPALVFKLLGKKVYYTHHNSRVANKLIFKILFKLSDKVILVNSKNLGIDEKMIHHSKIRNIPAFIPPADTKPLEKKVLDELRGYKHVVSANCSYAEFIDNKHLYGFDLLIESFSELCRQDKLKNTVLVLADPGGTAEKFTRSLINRFQVNDTCKILYLTDELNFPELINHSDMVVRPTRSDGDALTVREALYLNVPVIASNCSVRPEGTILFENESTADLAEKILSVINNKPAVYSSMPDYGKEVTALYTSDINSL